MPQTANRRHRKLVTALLSGLLLAPFAMVNAPAQAVPRIPGSVGCPAGAPTLALSDSYKATVEQALASKTDVLGQQALSAPGGPTYDNLKGELKPLMYALAPAASGSYLDDSGVYYLPFGQPTGLSSRDAIALHVADGSQIISDRSGNRSLRVYIGATGQERYGECLADLATPALRDGYLPVLETSYRDHDGVQYQQESFATDIPGTGLLASYVKLSATPGSSGLTHTQFRFSECPGCNLVRSGDTLVDSSGKTYLYFAPGATYSGGDLIYDADLTVGDNAVYLVRVTDAATGAPALKANGGAYQAALKQTTDYWNGRLSHGATFDVPEPLVMNAQRNLLIQNLLMTWRYSLGNPYEAFYQPESSDTVGTLGAYGFTDVYASALNDLLPLSKGANRRNWEEGEKLKHAADYYRLTHDAAFIQKNDPTYAAYAADFAAQVAADPNGLLEPQQYSSDIKHDVYGLHQIGVAEEGLKAILGVWKQIGRQDLVDQYTSLSHELDAAYGKAISESSITLPDGSLFTPADLLDGATPYDPITDTTLGSYWNLVAWYGFAAGAYGPGSPQAKATLQYAYDHGSRLLGLLRVRNGGTDDVYAVEQANFLADNDQADQLVLSLYGKLAAGMTQGTFIAGESDTVGPIASKWPKQTGYCPLTDPSCTGPSIESGWAPDEYYRAMYLSPNSANNTMFLDILHQMLVHEVDDASATPTGLQLGFFTPRGWLDNGKTVSVTDAPTAFGALTYRIDSRIAAREVLATVDVPQSTPGSLELRLRVPAGNVLSNVLVNGEPYDKLDASTGTINLSGLTGAVHVQAFYRAA
jgi:hypothetical protein